jgi:hypothetical protein
MSARYRSAKRRVALPVAALVLPGLLIAASAAALPTHLASRAVGAVHQAAPPSKPWPAPIGHRQPRAANVPVKPVKTASDAWLQRLNRRTDRKLQICRGC